MHCLCHVHSRKGYFVCFVALLTVYCVVEFCRARYNFFPRSAVAETSHFERECSIIATRESPGFPYPELSLQVYPETLMPGDTLYVKIVAKNPHEQPIYIRDDFLLIDTEQIRVRLRDSQGQEQPLFFEGRSGAHGNLFFLPCTEIESDSSRIIGAFAINVPPLEDLHEPFWAEHLDNLSMDGEKFLFSVTVNAPAWAEDMSRLLPQIVERTIAQELTTLQPLLLALESLPEGTIHPELIASLASSRDPRRILRSLERRIERLATPPPSERSKISMEVSEIAIEVSKKNRGTANRNGREKDRNGRKREQATRKGSGNA